MRALHHHIRNVSLQTLLFAALFAAPAFSQNPDAGDVTTGLIGHWKLDETNGSQINDSSSNANHGTWVDNENTDVTEEANNGKVSGSLVMDSDDRITIPAIGAYNVGTTGSFSISFWFKTSDPTITFLSAGAGNQIIAMSLDGGRVRFRMRDSLGNSLFFPYNCPYGCRDDSQWHLAVMVLDRDNNSAHVYIDDVEEQSFSDVSAVVGNMGATVNINVNSGSSEIDDIRYYDRALSHDDIALLYASFPGVMTCNAAYEAVMIFNHDLKVMQYCNGTDWINMGPREPGSNSLYEFTSHTFDNCGVTGRTGPTEPDCETQYAAASWTSNDSFFRVGTSDQGVQEWVVPRTGPYTIELAGAAGANNDGTTSGQGAVIQKTVLLTRGSTLNLVIGQMGSTSGGTQAGGGGGGSFAYTGSIAGSGLVAAAGGGGGGRFSLGCNATTIQPRTNTCVVTTNDGNGGPDESIGGGGSGWLTPGTSATALSGNQWSGGVGTANGGYGGGGANNATTRGGGGGGYSGAQGGNADRAGSGGSYPFDATHAGLNASHGYATITYIDSNCTSPDGEAGEVGYNFTEGVMQYCNGANWINMGPVIETNNYNYQGGPNNCATAGDQCTDNSYYIGTHPVTAEELFLADEDTQTALPWNNGNSTDLTVTGAIDTNDGPANTATNIATDADSATAGTQPHQASQYCEDLEAHGRSDWYLPAINELVLVYNGGGGNQFGNVNTSGSTDDYWSSSENNRNLRMNNGIQSNRAKHLLEYVRCMARGRTGLRLHLQFDETSGTTAADSSGNTLDGSLDNGLNAATNSVAGVAGRALDFDGSDDRVSIPADPLHNDSTTSTYAGWFYPTSTTQNRRFFENGVTILNQWSNGQIRIDMGRWSGGYANWETATGVITPNEWQHIALTYDYASTANDPVLYVNGVSVALTETTAPSGTVTDTANYAIFVGNRSDSARPWAGRIDDFRMYDRVLTASEVASLFANTGGGSLPVTGCPNIGDVCDDGTVYAGDHPTSGEKLYVPPADNASDINWGANSAFVTAALSNTDGAANTNALDGAVDVGAPYPAAQLCADLTAYGSSDWYLPARDELTVLYNNQGAIGGFDTGGEMYWSSTESTTLDPGERAWSRRFSDGYEWHNAMFVNTLSVRCMRIGSSVAGARCLNPPGTSGEMIYNDDNNVMQYCVGADDVPPNGWVETH